MIGVKNLPGYEERTFKVLFRVIVLIRILTKGLQTWNVSFVKMYLFTMEIWSLSTCFTPNLSNLIHMKLKGLTMHICYGRAFWRLIITPMQNRQAHSVVTAGRNSLIWVWHFGVVFLLKSLFLAFSCTFSFSYLVQTLSFLLIWVKYQDYKKLKLFFGWFWVNPNHWSQKKDWIELLLFRKWSQRKLAAAILLGPPWDPIVHVSIEKKIIWILPANDMLFR